MSKSKRKSPNYWTNEKCKELALTCSSKREFNKKYPGASRASYRYGWIIEYTWLKDTRFDLYKDKIDSIYAYEFVDQKSVYVGRTLIKRQKIRDWEHIFRGDTVSKFAKENNVPIPEMKILETNLTIEEGAKNEGIWVEKYKSEGWVILNIAKTGSIGSLGKGKSKYTYDICKELSSHCKNRREFERKYIQAYNISLRNNWLDEFFPIKYVRESKYTYNICKNLAKDCKKRKEYSEKYNQAYEISRKNGWIDEFFPKKYTYNICKELVKKCKNRGEFSKKYPGAYKVSLKNKWLDEFFPKNK